MIRDPSSHPLDGIRRENGGAPALTALVADGSPELSIVLPFLKQARTVGRCVERARRFLLAANLRGEVLVADNGSADRSVEIATTAGARVVHAPARGYGAALKAGIRAARAPWIAIGDSDDTYDFGELGPFVERLRAGCDLVIGNRFAGRIGDGAMPRLHRYLGNPALTLLARLFFGTRCGDVYCGIRAFRKEAVEAMALQSDGMEYAIEMVVKSAFMRLRVDEVPVTLSRGEDDRTPHLQTWRDGRRSLRLYLLCAPQWVFLYPGVALVAAGLAGGALVEAGAGRVGAVRFDVHTLLYCGFAILIGSQAIFFSLFSRLLAMHAGLLPRSAAWERWIERSRVKTVLFVAGFLFVAGLGGSSWAVETWRRAEFGDLDPFRMFRIVIPSAVLLALGCQVAFASLYMSLLRHYRERARDEPERAP